MKHIYKLKIYFIFLTSFLLWYSCAGNKPNETKNHPEIEKLWIEYFTHLNDNEFDEAYFDNVISKSVTSKMLF